METRDESKELVEKFCGIKLFSWTGWDETDFDYYQFYEVKFFQDSMKQYNGKTVCLKFGGELSIYDMENDEPIKLWDGYPTDIEEIMLELNQRHIVKKK